MNHFVQHRSHTQPRTKTNPVGNLNVKRTKCLLVNHRIPERRDVSETHGHIFRKTIAKIFFVEMPIKVPKIPISSETTSSFLAFL